MIAAVAGVALAATGAGVLAAAAPPAITLQPSCGPAGTTITVHGSNFGTGQSGFPITVTFDPQGQPSSSVQVPASSIDGTGAFTAQLTVPARPPSGTPYTVVANQTPPAGGITASARAFFSLPCTTLAVDPTCGSPGDPVTVTGTGFRADNTVTITFTPPATAAPIATAIPNQSTTFQTIVAVPNVPPGSYTFVASQTFNAAFGGPGLTARALFQVPCIKAMIVLKPAVGPPGTVTTVIGTGFPVGAVVQLSWNHGITITMTSITIPATQGFQVVLLIFPHDELGPRVVSASPDLTVTTAPLFNIATANFLVVPGTEQPRDFSWRH